MRELYYELKENYIIYIWFALFFLGRCYISYDNYNTNQLSGFFEWITISLVLGGVFALTSGAYIFGILIGIKNGYEFYKDKQYAASFANFTFSLFLSGLLYLIFPAIINLIIS